jgi:hypothetical protein
VDDKLYLILGCFGRTDDGFVSCSSCENRILLVHPQLCHYQQMMDYFDNCDMFDKTILDYNAIRNILQNMQGRFDQLNRPLWHEKELALYQKFLTNHQSCGLYLKLLIIPGLAPHVEQIEEKPIKIIAKSNLKKTKIKLNNRRTR